MTDQLPGDIRGRRMSLEGIAAEHGSTHAGLWFDRYYLKDRSPLPKPEAEQKRALLVRVAELRAPERYRDFYHLWKVSLPADCLCAIAEVCGRMVIGTGDKGVAEAGITLHHTYGVPYIPGSALKGLASAYANLRLEGFAEPEGNRTPEPPLDEESLGGEPKATPDVAPYHTLFGAENSAGYVTFFDALYIPGTTRNDCPLAPDVITGHHSDYYVGETPKPPADWDSPIPAPFLTATGRYLIALAGPTEWVHTALRIIGMALRDSGVGAKTAAGYGRMRLLDLDDTEISLPSMYSVHNDQIPNQDPISSTPPALVTQPASTRSIPVNGAVFAGKVIERNERTILISVPGHTPEAVLATLAVTEDIPSWRVGDLARVEVAGSEERGGRVILNVRRAPRTKKS